MKLNRDLVWFDAESTGIDTETARIIELACIKIKTDGTVEQKEIRINPEIPIPLESTEVHGITDEMVKDCPKFKQVASSMRSWFDGCDLAGFNSNNYDVPLLSAEFVRAGLKPIDWEPNLLDVLQLYRHLYPNTLSDVYKRLTGKELEGAHEALSDVVATKDICDILLKEMVVETVEGVDKLLQADKIRVDLAGKMYRDSEGVAKWNFGKNKNMPITKNDSFNSWFMKQNFPQNSKDKLTEVINSL